jgi:predicted Fe-Mo cluster-binding NifX family protein
MTMKICVPASDRKVSRNFGKAVEFLILNIEDGRIISSDVIPNPGREKVKVPAFVAALGITHLIAGGIGNPAIAVFKGEGIEVTSGAEGPIETVVERYCHGTLESRKMSCAGENKCGAQHSK